MIKRSIKIYGHATSVSLEQDFWDTLNDIAQRRTLSLNKLIEEIDKSRTLSNLSSAIRLYILHDLTNRLAIAEGRE